MWHVLAMTNPNSPPRMPHNGVASNLLKFSHAFACKAGQPMVREDAGKVWRRNQAALGSSRTKRCNRRHASSGSRANVQSTGRNPWCSIMMPMGRDTAVCIAP